MSEELNHTYYARPPMFYQITLVGVDGAIIDRASVLHRLMKQHGDYFLALVLERNEELAA